jgi:hypothetical protein
MRLRAAFVLLVPLVALAACVNAGLPTTNGVVVVPNPFPPVPPPLADHRPPPPPTEDQLVWRPGEWEWADSGYTWRPGEYEKLDGHSNQYLPGHWAAQGNAWLWERGHWL